jgi:hypothetical protein
MMEVIQRTAQKMSSLIFSAGIILVIRGSEAISYARSRYAQRKS